jgi:sialate O-acetylesterase
LRLARITLNKAYGLKNVAYLGPKYKSFKVEKDGTVKVSFTPESIVSGLATSDKQAPKHFYLAGTDKVFHKAEARIVNNQVLLYNDKVKKPVAVRYAFTNYPITNLQNNDGLPAMPFRTDNWEDKIETSLGSQK